MSGYNNIVNGAPFNNALGTYDGSTRPVPREPDEIPTHLPFFYIWAQRGPVDKPQLVRGNTRQILFGTDTFDIRKKWANHATVFCNEIHAEGNAMMIQRIVPADMGPRANILLSLEVLETQVDDYQRDIDGSIANDPVTGDPIVLGQIDGFKVRWVVDHVNTVTDYQNQFGARTIGPGTWVDDTDPLNPVYSQKYPIFDIAASSPGDDGNLSGIRIWSPADNIAIGKIDDRILDRDRVYPFRVSVIRKNTASGTASVQDNIWAEQTTSLALKPGAIDSTTDRAFYVGDRFVKEYNQEGNERYAQIDGDFNQFHIYQANVDAMLKNFYEFEKNYIDALPAGSNVPHDFAQTVGLDDGDIYLFNMFGGTTYSGYPYHTFQIDAEDVSAKKLDPYTNLYAAGSSDGTMTDASFAALVGEKIQEYADPNTLAMDDARRVESIFYDSGFPLEVKNKLLAFIAERKDTFVALCTHDVAKPVDTTASEENSLAVALRARATFYPESAYFGTHVMRALIMGRSGVLRGSQYTKRLSPLVEVAKKTARYMGAGNGRWRPGRNFDGAPGSILDYMSDINIDFTPVSVRNRDWDAGLNWVQSYDLRSNFIPALKTVYNDDTSVLNSFITAMAIVEINKVAGRCWRYFSGVSGLTNRQLSSRVEEFMNKHLQGRFDDRFVIRPRCYYTAADEQRGYSWTLATEIYAPNMKTVQTSFVEAYRREDLERAG